uniref:Hexosyltransferase n=1 Tax=Syphacia muris TaxID=451379 RepID=A0A0N5ACW9_9BILA
LTNYTERSLLPFRLACYTESEFIRSPLNRDLQPRYTNFNQCIQHYFPGQRPPEHCYLKEKFNILVNVPLSEDVKQIVVVRNAPNERGYRNHIRRSWKSGFTSRNVPVIFFSGVANNQSAEFNDIIQVDFREAYFNLTLKMIIAYNYFLDKYPNIQRIIAINDDTIANVTSLLQIPTTDRAQIVGKVSRGYPRIIFWWVIWFVPSTMYPHICYP